MTKNLIVTVTCQKTVHRLEPENDAFENLLSQGIEFQVSNEKSPGWLGCIRDYTTQVYRDYNKPL